MEAVQTTRASNNQTKKIGFVKLSNSIIDYDDIENITSNYLLSEILDDLKNVKVYDEAEKLHELKQIKKLLKQIEEFEEMEQIQEQKQEQNEKIINNILNDFDKLNTWSTDSNEMERLKRRLNRININTITKFINDLSHYNKYQPNFISKIENLIKLMLYIDNCDKAFKFDDYLNNICNLFDIIRLTKGEFIDLSDYVDEILIYISNLIEYHFKKAEKLNTKKKEQTFLNMYNVLFDYVYKMKNLRY